MLSNAESGAERIGTIRVYGTGGTKGANWEAFGNCFYNPGKNDMLPMENIWDANSRHAVCGFFFPQIWDYEPFVEDGNSLLFASWKDDYDKKRGAEKEKDAGEYNIYVGQRANSPNEAFTNTQENIFTVRNLLIILTLLNMISLIIFMKMVGIYLMMDVLDLLLNRNVLNELYLVPIDSMNI